MKAFLRAGRVCLTLLGDDQSEGQVTRIRITIWDYRMVLAWAFVVGALVTVLLVWGPQILKAVK